MSPASAHHVTYDHKQISAYFNHISLPQDSQDLPLVRNKLHHPNNALAFLTKLQQQQLATVPFENISLHYSQHHSISIDPDHLYTKIVEYGRGGYCMENNCFFGTILRSLGFTVHSAGARVSNAADGMSGEDYHGWSHMVNIVTLTDGKKYMLDVGFGGNGPIRPLLLDAENSQAPAIYPAGARLIYQNIPENSDPNQKLWIYQHRKDPQSNWVPMYSFTELEFLPQDYEIMNFWTSQSRKSWFTQKLVAVKMIIEAGEVVGEIILMGAELKSKVRGVTKYLATLETEEERVDALETWFLIELREEEKAGIRGMVTELKG